MAPALKPILMSGPMVRAILAGTKTQTRRVIKDPDHYACLTGDCPHEHRDQCAAWLADNCPIVRVGDTLFVRETTRRCGVPKPKNRKDRDDRVFKARAKLLLRDLSRNPRYQRGGKALEHWNIAAETLLTFEAMRRMAHGEVIE